MPRFTRILVVPAVVAAYVGLTPGIALASSCNFVSGAVGVTMTTGTSTLSRDVAGAILLDNVQCGSATVTTASGISVGGAGGTLRLDLANGGFAPGSVDETDGIDEMPISWNALGTALEILGTSGPDDIWHAGTGGVHLNGDADQDIGFNQQPFSVTIDGAGGDDYLDTSRPNGNGNPAWNATVIGGTGNDVVRGDSGTDTLSGGDGNDQVADGLGNDGTVSGGDGDDRLYATKTQRDQTFSPNAAIPDSGTATNVLNVNNMGFADDLEIRVTIVHPATSTLTVEVQAPSAVSPMTLATGRPGTGFYGTVFDDDAASSITAGSGTYTGRFRPSGGAFASIYESSSISGAWTLSVTDGATDAQTGTIVSWSVHVAGSQFGSGFPTSATNGDEAYDGGTGNDALRYAARNAGVTFDATTATSGTSGDDPESDTYTGIEELVGGFGTDTFHGSTGNDVWTGRSGDDMFVPGPGDDTVDCGDFFDDDTLDYSAAPAGIEAVLADDKVTAEGLDTLKGCDSVVGSDFADTITGTDGHNTVYGMAGDDTITLLAGPDSVYPGAGTDTVDAGDDGDDLLVEAGDGADDTLGGGAGTDRIFYEAAATGVSVSLDDVANDGVTGEQDDVGADIENVITGPYDDVVAGDDDDNEITTGDGNDVVTGNGGSDGMVGGNGTDTLSYATAPNGVVVLLLDGVASGEGDDFFGEFENVVGSAFADDLEGTSGANTIRPGLGADLVSSHQGDDTLVAEPVPDGADTWNPGEGDDTADYALRTTAVSVTLDDEANDGAAGEGDDVPNGVEVVRGGLAGDAIVGGLEANTFYGGPGNDTLLGRGGADTLYGEAGDDAVIGSSGNDVLFGGIGHDSVSGGEGDDRLRGDVGNDTLLGGLGDDDEFGEDGNDKFVQGDTASANGSDLLVGGSGTDTATYSGRAGGVTVDVDGQFDDGQALEQDNVSRDVEAVEGSSYNDTLTGNELANTLRGGAGNDKLTGLLGNDTLDGGTGNDTFAEGSAASGKDSFTGGTGVDTLDYTLRTSAVKVDLDNAADDGATGELDNARSDVEYVRGGSGSDTLTGSSGANRLYGNAGNDVLTGGLGADILDGGTGNDTLYGKDAVRDTLLGGTGTDKARRDTIDSVASIESYF